MVNKILEKTKDQNQRNTIVEFAYAFVLTRKCDNEERKKCLKQLQIWHSICGIA